MFGQSAMVPQPQAFLSYTRVDDEFFGGAITSLRHLLELGVKVVTGDGNFQIFQDVDGIDFGQKWQKILDQEISKSIFLIPVITPSFFRSEACRDELLKFLKHEKSLGRDDLVLPIYFVTTPLLERADLLQADSLALEISSRQRYDWRSRADLPITDVQVKKAVRDLAEKIYIAIERVSVMPRAPVSSNQQGIKELDNASNSFVKQEENTRLQRSLILWVDDRPDNNIIERKSMEEHNIDFVLAKSTEEALNKISRQNFDVIISDMGRPSDRLAGFTLLNQIRAHGNQTPYFIYAGSRAHQHVAEALRLGAQGTTNIPDELISMVLASLKS
jgi:CheY-like chemotaxis protein